MGSGFTAALVDVVFHQRDDLLKLVLQLSASSRRARVQRHHHLRHTQQYILSLSVFFKGILTSVIRGDGTMTGFMHASLSLFTLLSLNTLMEQFAVTFIK